MTTSAQHDQMLADMHQLAGYAAKSLLPSNAPTRQIKITSYQIFVGAVQHAIGNGRMSSTPNAYTGGSTQTRPTSHAARIQADR